MSDLVEFVLRLKDMMSPALKGMGSSSKNTFGGIEKDINNTQKKLSDLAKPVKMTVDTNSLRSAHSELDQLHGKINSIGDTWSMFKGSFMGSLASQGVMAAARGIGNVGQQALSAGMNAEQQIIGLKTFVGAQRANELYADIQKLSALTPFTTADILPGVQQLIASGQTPEHAKADTWNLMNALSATGNAGNSFMFGLMSSHMSQAAAAGKIDGLLLREFQRTAHIPVERLLANDLYPTLSATAGMKRVKDLDSITYDQFTHALQRAAGAGGMFAGALEAQSKTIAGKWSTIRDWWNIGLAKAVLNPQTHDNIVKLEDRMIEGLSKFPELISTMTPHINNLIDGLMEMQPYIYRFGSGLMDLIKPVGGIFASDEFKGLTKNLLDFSTELTQLATPAVKTFADGIKTAMGNIGDELGSVADIIYFIKHGKMRTTVGASGMVQGIETMSKWQSVSNFIFPKWLTGLGGIGDKSAANLAKGQNTWMGAKNQVPWTVPGHNFLSGGPGAGYMPGLAGGGSFGVTPKVTGAGGGSGTSDAIIGGGSKVIQIHFRNFTEHFTVNAGDMKEGVNETFRKFEEWYYRLLKSVPG